MLKEDLVFNKKFKNLYLIISVVCCILWISVAFVFKMLGNSFLLTNDLFIYYFVFLYILSITAFILDEKIKKNSGLLVFVGGMIYCFSYIFLNTLRIVNITSVLCSVISFILIFISIVFNRLLYPTINISDGKKTYVNLFYLITILSITFILTFNF